MQKDVGVSAKVCRKRGLFMGKDMAAWCTEKKDIPTSHLGDVHRLEMVGIYHILILVDCVCEGSIIAGFFNANHVKAVSIIPTFDLVILLLFTQLTDLILTLSHFNADW